jgi:hypothetical protein
MASVASARLQIGVGDESFTVFSNPWFQQLGVKRTRLITPYNATTGTAQQQFTQYEWLASAHAAHEQIVVAFNPASGSGCPGHPCVLPSASAYTKAFKAFHKQFPYVTVFQPWNEVNSVTQPTQAHPQAVVLYYTIIRKYCPKCTVLGADIEDLTTPHQSDEVVYAKELLAAYKRAHVKIPQIWGLHNYVDTNYFTKTGTQAALKTLPGQIWLSETGGIAQFILSSGKVRLKYDEARQSRATTWMMKLALGNKRITRVYVYDMLYNGSPNQRFDSSLLGPGQVPRPAYYVLLHHYEKYFS